MSTPLTYSRKDYFDGKANPYAAHRRYYGQFVTQRERDLVQDYIGIDILLGSTDPHFNDIRLAKWDALHRAVHASTWQAMRAAGDNGPVSLSNSVCLFKEAARQVIEAHQK